MPQECSPLRRRGRRWLIKDLICIGRSAACGELAITQRKAAVGRGRCLSIVGDKQNACDASRARPSPAAARFRGCDTVKIPSRLVGKDQTRFARERASDRDTLSLASRKRLRSVFEAIRQAYTFKPRNGPSMGLTQAEAANDQLARRILDRRNSGHEMEALENKSHITQQILACLALGESGQVTTCVADRAPSGLSSAAIRSKSVVLPEPLGPSSANISPEAIVKLTPSTARTSSAARDSASRRLRARAPASPATRAPADGARAL